ncbi:MAG: MBL fold metallo-hydrolase [Anaerolineae bacterium]|jgi:glyoxylase-like metal-dependent hydrolase (beta-lactamase superfamily II)
MIDIQRIPVRETNCYLLRGEGGTILVDPGPPGVAQEIVAGAEAGGVPPGEVRLIFVTHGHLDHYGAAREIRTWCGAPVAAYPGEPAFSRERRNALPPAQTLRGTVVRWFYLLLSPLADFAPLEADLLLEDGADLAPYGVEARTLLLPGHSPGSLGIVTGEGDVFVGDLLVNYAVPSQPVYLSDSEAWQRSVERLRGLAPRTVYVGHGEPFAGEALAKIYPARYQFRWWVR